MFILYECNECMELQMSKLNIQRTDVGIFRVIYISPSSNKALDMSVKIHSFVPLSNAAFGFVLALNIYSLLTLSSPAHDKMK